MVLAELGSKITAALQRMNKSVVLDESVLASLLNTIAVALLQADVDVHLVRQLQDNIKAKCKLNELASGCNKRKLIHSAVIKELHRLLDTGRTPYRPVKGKTNVILFVGLQGAGEK